MRLRGVLPALALAAACAKPYLPVRATAPPVPPAPAGVVYASETFTGDGGVELFARSWRPAGEARGVLAIMHGLRDHGDRYTAFAAELVARGYAVHAFDLRGHGRSSGRRVTIGSFDEYVRDFDRFVARVREREPGKPLFVFGHSMGGAIVTLYAQGRSDLAGVILSAPAIRIDVPPLVAAATILSGTLTPNFGGLAPDNRHFSTDPAVEADMGRDPLIFQPPGPVATAKGLVGAIERVWAGVGTLRAPLLALHGTGDKLTAPAGSREIVERAGSSDKTLRLYEGAAHDLVHEPKRAEVTADVIAWLDAHTGGPAAPFTPPPAQRLRGDGAKPHAAVGLDAGYRRTATDDAAQWGGGGVRARFLLGRRIAWPLAVDGEAYGGDVFMYRAAAYPLGVAFVCPCGNNISVAAGAGVSDVGLGAAFELPLAVDAELQLGSTRLLLWARAARLLGDDIRVDGNDLPLIHELRTGAALRLGRNHQFWSNANAGSGPYLGVTYDRIAGVSVFGLVLGLHLWGGS